MRHPLLQYIRKRLGNFACVILLGLPWLAPSASAASAAARPVLLGLDAEFGLANSTSAQALEMGIRVAIAEVNGAGGVLGGRPLKLVTRDNRSIPARGIRNLAEFAAMPDMAAVFGGRFSPVIIEQLPKLKKAGIPFLVAWSSADPIIDNGMEPNYVFRLSLRDGLAMPKMLEQAKKRGLNQVGLLLINTSWGRSNLAAAEKTAATASQPKIVQTAWYNFTDTSLIDKYHKLRDAGAQALLLVGNEYEAAILVREVAALPPAQRIPIISHWGLSGGNFIDLAGPALSQVDLSVIQTFSFFHADPKVLPGFMRTLGQLYGIDKIERIESPAGVAHAYDMTHILARAIELAGGTERDAIRDALEKLGAHRGLVRNYTPPFTPARHEALGPEQLLMARFRDDGVLVPEQD